MVKYNHQGNREKVLLQGHTKVGESSSGLEVIKLEFIIKFKIKPNDWLLADTCPQAANHCALF